MAVIYNAATTINGFLADDEDSLRWLFDVSDSGVAAEDINHFLKDIDALVMGSTTYQWLLSELDSPAQLTENHGDRPTFNRRLASDKLSLAGTRRLGQFVELSYEIN